MAHHCGAVRQGRQGGLINAERNARGLATRVPEECNMSSTDKINMRETNGNGSRPLPEGSEAPPRSIEPEILHFIQRSRWHADRTMPELPHQYVVIHWRPEQQRVFERFARFIQEQGQKERPATESRCYCELEGWKYWTAGAPADETIIINRSKSVDSPG